MALFRRKQQLFGSSIEPSCLYCRYNAGEDRVKCPNFIEGKESCKRFQYDPTKRVPKGQPKLGSYSEDDFSL